LKTFITLILSISIFSFANENSFVSQNEFIILQQRVNTLNERVDGLTTLIEGLNMEIAELKSSKNSIKNSDINLKLNDLETKINLLSNKDKSEEISEKNISVSTQKPPKKIIIKSSKLYTQGVQLFIKHKYDDAKKKFEITDKRNYKRASSNYYLGEISFYTKKYNDAIFYFKKSVGIYDNASYNDKLLLHTAISLEKINDKKQAKIFYEMIIETYPNKSSAIVAKENLLQL